MVVLQPFDRHPADAGGLGQAATQLSDQAAEAVDASRITLHAFAPAPQNWDGIAAPELRAAPAPVRERALAVSQSLSWASVAMEYWAGRVAAFNKRVDQIRAGLDAGSAKISAATGPDGDPLPAGEVAVALQALRAQAERLWWTAYNADIVDGGQTAAAMLRDGPTSENVAAAQSVGLLPPGQPWSPLYPISRSFQRSGLSPFDFPFPLVPLLGDCPLDDEYANNIIDGATDGAQLANAFQLPFKEGMHQMLGGAVGDAGVDVANDEMDSCITPIDLPAPPPPPPPPPQPESPGFPGNVINAVDGAIDDAGDWVDQAGEDLAYEIEHPPPMPFPLGPPPSLEPD